MKQIQHFRKYKSGKIALINRGNIRLKSPSEDPLKTIVAKFPFNSLAKEWSYYLLDHNKIQLTEFNFCRIVNGKLLQMDWQWGDKPLWYYQLTHRMLNLMKDIAKADNSKFILMDTDPGSATMCYHDDHIGYGFTVFKFRDGSTGLKNLDIYRANYYPFVPTFWTINKGKAYAYISNFKEAYEGNHWGPHFIYPGGHEGYKKTAKKILSYLKRKGHQVKYWDHNPCGLYEDKQGNTIYEFDIYEVTPK